MGGTLNFPKQGGKPESQIYDNRLSCYPKLKRKARTGQPKVPAAGQTCLHVRLCFGNKMGPPQGGHGYPPARRRIRACAIEIIVPVSNRAVIDAGGQPLFAATTTLLITGAWHEICLLCEEPRVANGMARSFLVINGTPRLPRPATLRDPSDGFIVSSILFALAPLCG